MGGGVFNTEMDVRRTLVGMEEERTGVVFLPNTGDSTTQLAVQKPPIRDWPSLRGPLITELPGRLRRPQEPLRLLSSRQNGHALKSPTALS